MLILAPKLISQLGIPKTQFTDHMKLKKMEDLGVDASVLLRRGNKILTGGNMETICGKTIQILTHLGIPNLDTIVDPRKYLLTEA